MQCSCEIDSCADEPYRTLVQKIKTHNSSSVILACGECGDEIKLGDQFEFFKGEFDGEFYTHHTCMDCLSFRDNFFGSWTFEGLWEDFASHMDDCGWQVPESCLSRVTPKVRAKICECIENEWEYQEMEA